MFYIFLYEFNVFFCCKKDKFIINMCIWGYKYVDNLSYREYTT